MIGEPPTLETGGLLSKYPEVETALPQTSKVLKQLSIVLAGDLIVPNGKRSTGISIGIPTDAELIRVAGIETNLKDLNFNPHAKIEAPSYISLTDEELAQSELYNALRSDSQSLEFLQTVFQEVLPRTTTLAIADMPSIYLSNDKRNITRLITESKEELSNLTPSLNMTAILPHEFKGEIKTTIGVARAKYLSQVLNWQFPGSDLVPPSPDLTKYDKRAIHILEQANDGRLLSSLRMVFPKLPEEKLDVAQMNKRDKVKIIKGMDLMLTNELNRGTDPYEQGTMDQIVGNDEVFNQLYQAYQNGEIVSIERLILGDIGSDPKNSKLEERIKYKLKSALLISPVMAMMAGTCLRLDKPICLIQANNHFLSELLKMFGPESVQQIAKVTQEDASGSPDTCNTLILNINRAFDFVKKTNPPFSSMVEQFTFS